MIMTLTCSFPEKKRRRTVISTAAALLGMIQSVVSIISIQATKSKDVHQLATGRNPKPDQIKTDAPPDSFARKLRTSISTDRTSYASGDSIQVHFSAHDVSTGDWIGIYPAEASPDSLSNDPVLWVWACGSKTCYDGASFEAVDFGSDAMSGGQYRVHYIPDGGYSLTESIYKAIASSELFTITLEYRIYPDRRCRTDEDEAGNDGYEYTMYEYADTHWELHQCKEHCSSRSFCTGFEYNKNGNCEIWEYKSVEFLTVKNDKSRGAYCYWKDYSLLPQPTPTPTTPEPTNGPTNKPTHDPTRIPTKTPTNAPTEDPTGIPTKSSTTIPTNDPTNKPINDPTGIPTKTPTDAPTEDLTGTPTKSSTTVPTKVSTNALTPLPTRIPTKAPTGALTDIPTRFPTDAPVPLPTQIPKKIPTSAPTVAPAIRISDPTETPTEILNYTPFDTETPTGTTEFPTTEAAAPTDPTSSPFKTVQTDSSGGVMISDPTETPIEILKLTPFSTETPTGTTEFPTTEAVAPTDSTASPFKTVETDSQGEVTMKAPTDSLGTVETNSPGGVPMKAPTDSPEPAYSPTALSWKPVGVRKKHSIASLKMTVTPFAHWSSDTTDRRKEEITWEEVTAKQIQQHLERDKLFTDVGATDIRVTTVLVREIPPTRMLRELEFTPTEYVSFDADISYHVRKESFVDTSPLDEDVRSTVAASFDSYQAVAEYLEKLQDRDTFKFVDSVKLSAQVTTDKEKSTKVSQQKLSEGIEDTMSSETFSLLLAGISGCIVATLVGFWSKRDAEESDSFAAESDSSFFEDDISKITGDTSQYGNYMTRTLGLREYSLKGEEPSTMGDDTITDSMRSKKSEFSYSKAYAPKRMHRDRDKDGGKIPVRNKIVSTDGDVADDASFELRYRDHCAASEREKILHIFAPPGILGVIIDTPEDGASVVRTIRQCSPLRDELLVGDTITAINDEDIQNLNAIEVSRLISSRMNLQRKFTVVRTC